MKKVSEKMETVRKGSILALSITGSEIVEGDFNNVKVATEVAVRVGWDTKINATADVVQAVFTVMDDSNYGVGDGIRELLVKTARKNAWLYPVSDLTAGVVEYDCKRRENGKTEKFVVRLTFEAVIYDSMAEYKKVTEQAVKKAKTPKKALKPKKEENASTDGVEA